MAHFNYVINQNAKWGHVGFYIDCHRMTVYRKIFFYKKALITRQVCIQPSTSGNRSEEVTKCTHNTNKVYFMVADVYLR